MVWNADKAHSPHSHSVPTEGGEAAELDYVDRGLHSFSQLRMDCELTHLINGACSLYGCISCVLRVLKLLAT